MELLSRLLGSVERVKIMRFFLHHDERVCSLLELENKTKIKKASLKKEVQALSTLSFLEKKKGKTVVTEGKKQISKIKEVVGFALNKEFPYIEALKALLFDFRSFNKKDLVARFKALGRIKLLLVAGIFIGDKKSRLDILIVGEGIKKSKIEKVFEGISAEIGRDVVYAVMDLEEYEYRIKMYDKFMRDVLDMPHEKIIDKIAKEY